MRKLTLTLASLLVIASLLLAGCGATTPKSQAGTNSLSGTISVSGAFALYPMMTVWADEFHKLNPDVEFDVQGGGAGKGMTDTIAGAGTSA
jgi:phosphate transport system substrate-binding protein